MSWDQHPGSSTGLWCAFIEPLRTRSMVLHLFRRNGYGSANIITDKKGIKTVEAVDTFEVTFSMHKCPEGDFSAAGPTMKSQTGFGERGEVMDFLQAVTDEAARWGIYASGAKDTTKELSATRAHLDDLRRLILPTDKYKELR